MEKYLKDGRNEGGNIRKQSIPILWQENNGGIVGNMSGTPFNIVLCVYRLKKLVVSEGFLILIFYLPLWGNDNKVS